MLDQGQGMVPYQGFTPIAGGSLAACAETYFAQSEQVPTRIRLAVGEELTGGGGRAWRARWTAGKSWPNPTAVPRARPSPAWPPNPT